ncbi:energy transducer TonB [Myroides pelagicus]|uniref:Energy transducer TonB n=1 Tax=Myroides pelagicus TaxID=270914 RepID=A0A7K1GNI8_9FLAO|nr:energy transducer TonB [Myroides pelagicus]MEC4114384.1 energy transducer TonB [Myroides pelagicus]MTH30109.1 energy transducer TonB [Myroides pelagicus]
MSKLNIFKKDWLDIVFEGRNKSYGAYELRATNPKVTTLALIGGIGLFSLAILSPRVFGELGKERNKGIDKEVVIQTIEMPDVELPPPPPPPPPVEETPPPPPPAVKSVNDTKKFTEPVVDKKENASEEPPKQEEFKDDVDPGQKDAEGDKEKGEIKTGESTGDADKDDKPEEDPNTVFVAVQHQASYPGGMPAFQKQFISRFRTPDIDSSTRRIQVIVQFIVEKDGSLTDIKVLRDPGYGAGREAVRVLNGMPKWKPAQQNGRTVRSQFTLPITIQVQ